MAQAEMINTPAPERTEEALYFRAFEMECDLCDLAQMAKIAELILHDLVGRTDFDGCRVVRHDLSREGVSRAAFAVSHVSKLIETFSEKYILAMRQTEH